MPSNSPFSHARADCRKKSGTPPVRPQSHALHLDGLRASLDPLLVVLASQYLGPLQTPPRGRRQRTSGNETASEKNQQLADARALRLTPQSTVPKYLPAGSVRDNASSEPEGIKGSTFFYILRTSTMPGLSTSRRGIRLILSMEGRSSARSSLGVHPLPARSNGLRNALGPYHFLAFPGPHNQPQPLGPHAVREVFRTSRACACACAREAMRPFLNNGTTFTTCKPIAPQRPRPSEQSPKPPRIARAKNELGARSRAKPASLLTRPSLARARARAD